MVFTRTMVDRLSVTSQLTNGFSCHPNNAKVMLNTYREIYAELSDSNLLQFILRQSLNNPDIQISVTQFGDEIRKSEYILF